MICWRTLCRHDHLNPPWLERRCRVRDPTRRADHLYQFSNPPRSSAIERYHHLPVTGGSARGIGLVSSGPVTSTSTEPGVAKPV